MIVDKLGNMFEDRRKKDQKVLKDKRKEDNKIKVGKKSTNKNKNS